MSHEEPAARAVGVTASERRLGKLCERTFLSLWSYPGVYRDQGRADGKGDGKEVCDLLVVFQDHVIIFSDKDCAFPETGNLHLDWSRWYRSAVLASSKQIWGAERWLKDHRARLYLDRSCSTPFPLDLPELKNATFHRILVAHGASSRCQRELGGMGALRILPDIVGEMHLARPEDGGVPFAIGQLDPKKGYIHVFDDVSLDIVMTELDTITDFVTYLSEKEQLIVDGKLESAASEVDLLADYLFPREGIFRNAFSKAPKGQRLSIPDGVWKSYEQDGYRLKKIEEDETSYLWDKIIETSSHHIIAGTEYFATETGIRSGAQALRILAAEKRSSRRYLAAAIRDLVVATEDLPQNRVTRVIQSTRPNAPYYAFLLLSNLTGVSEEEYREFRRNLLGGLCEVVKLRYPKATDIVGFATEKGREAFQSQDVLYRDARVFTDDDRENAEKIVKATGLLTNVTQGGMTYSEFPHPATPPMQVPFNWKPRRMKGRDRNQPCSCGSGMKFKRCCGR